MPPFLLADLPLPTGASAPALDAPRKTCYTYAVTPSTSGTPSPLPSPSGGERTIEDSSSLGNVDWPVERTATRAVGQTDGVLSDINFGEVYPFVTKPLARDGLARYIGPTLGAQVAGLRRRDPLVLALNPIAFVAGRPYMDLSGYINLPGIAHQLGVFEAIDHSKGAVIVQMARAGTLHPLRISFFERVRLQLAYVRIILRAAWWLIRRRTPLELLDASARTTERLRTVVRRPLASDAPAILLGELDREFDDGLDATKDGLRPLALAMFLHMTLRLLCDKRAAPELIDDLSKGIPNHPTTLVSLDLWNLAQQAEPLAALFEKTPVARLACVLEGTDEGRSWWKCFEGFLERHGHRGEVELDITTPRWREDPTFLLQTVANYLRHTARTPTPPELLARGMRHREAAASTIRERLPWPQRSLFDRLYERYVLWLPFREAAKYTWLLGLEHARRVYRELGRRLAVEGHLKTADDVFWLRLGEVTAWAESGRVSWTQPVLDQREQEWQAWMTLRPPALIIGTRGTSDADHPLAPTLLRGTPASSGSAEGIARIILDPHDATLYPGEILITRYTDPTWTPLFFTAGALITEIGGVLSHGAVVAREVGLPAIVGVAGATSRIMSGQRIRVNATQGTVELL